MIGKLKGLVDSIQQDSAIVDVNGVGYHIYCSAKSLSQMETGLAVTMLIDTHVREDHIHLYGFIKEEEQQWFRLLGTVQGVGAKMALAILSALTPPEIANAIMAADAKTLTRANGVGQKLALRLITELKDKAIVTGSSFAVTGATKSTATKSGGVFEDALSALINLGYARGDAFQALAVVRAKANEDAPLSAIIPLALKEIGSGLIK